MHLPPQPLFLPPFPLLVTQVGRGMKMVGHRVGSGVLGHGVDLIRGGGRGVGTGVRGGGVGDGGHGVGFSVAHSLQSLKSSSSLEDLLQQSILSKYHSIKILQSSPGVCAPSTVLPGKSVRSCTIKARVRILFLCNAFHPNIIWIFAFRLWWRWWHGSRCHSWCRIWCGSRWTWGWIACWRGRSRCWIRCWMWIWA